MSSANPLRRASHGQLLKLGVDVGQATVGRYRHLYGETLGALTQMVLNRMAMIGIGDPFNADAEAASSSLPATT